MENKLNESQFMSKKCGYCGGRGKVIQARVVQQPSIVTNPAPLNNTLKEPIKRKEDISETEVKKDVSTPFPVENKVIEEKKHVHPKNLLLEQAMETEGEKKIGKEKERKKEKKRKEKTKDKKKKEKKKDRKKRRAE
jgi:hypothetical protein